MNFITIEPLVEKLVQIFFKRLFLNYYAPFT